MARNFIPALRFQILSPLFDPFVALFMNERRFRAAIVRGLVLAPDSRLLDFGCGTGTLLGYIARAHRTVVLEGVDVDPDILEIARRKTARLNPPVELTAYDGTNLPFPEGEFDCVVSSLVFHHLGSRQPQALSEIYRVLRPGGQVLIADFGIPGTAWSRFISAIMARIEPLGDNLAGHIPERIRNAGFDIDPDATVVIESFLGTLALYSGIKPVR